MKVLSNEGLTKLIQLIKGTYIANTDTVATTEVTLSTVATSGNYSDLSGTPTAFSGADGTNAGTSGLVPAPTATDNTKFLKGDGTWATVSGGGGSSYTAGDGIIIQNDEISVDGVTATLSDAEMIEEADVEEISEVALNELVATVAITGSYSDLINKPNIVSSVSSSSTNADAVGAKLFYDTVGDIEAILANLNSGDL